MNSPDYRCPKCGGNSFKRWGLTHPVILHWVLNPGVAFNEIVLGQRVPKVQLVCTACEDTWLDRSYIPCPSCHAMHPVSRGSRDFGNWRGIACPTCGASIPCLWNVLSLAILAASSPIWTLPYFLYFRRKPLRPMYELTDAVPPTDVVVPMKFWIWFGVACGALIWVTGVFAPALWSLRKGAFPWGQVLFGIPVCGAGGLAFAFLAWFLMGRRPKPRQK